MDNFNLSRAKWFSIIYVFAFMFLSGGLIAQTTFDISGTFEGVRKQLDKSQQEYVQEFEYRYELQQKGDKVEGISVIYNEDGDYAEVMLKGLVVGNKFYFEEYEILDEIKTRYQTWCYKVGVLEISRINGEIVLKGNTDSYMSNYGLPCTGGFTQLSKTDNSSTDEPTISIDVDVAAYSVYPNPTAAITELHYKLPNADNISIEVYDLNGSLISKEYSGKQAEGSHSESINLSAATPGLYIVKLTVGKEVYSTQVMKTER